MNKMYSSIRIALFVLCATFLSTSSVFAIEVNPEDFGAVVNDGNDDSAAIQAAVDRIFEAGGGTIFFPSGKLEVHRIIRLVPANYIGAEVKLKGNRGSVIEVSTGGSELAFYGGNLNTWTFEDLTFLGKKVPEGDPKFYDAGFVVYSNYVNQTNIIRCQFLGMAVRTDRALIYVGRTDAKIVDSQFDGSLGQYPDGAVVLAAADSIGLTISRSTFLDYANYGGVYLSKSPGYTGAWVRVKGGLPLNAIGQRRFVIEDSRFDEAAAAAIHIENVTWAKIRGISVNVNGASPGKGIYLKDVEHAMVEQSWFGYATADRPAIVTENVGVLEVNSLRLTGGVFFLDKRGDGEVDIKHCPQCTSVPAKKF